MLTQFLDQVIAVGEGADDLEVTIARYVASVLARAPEVRGRPAWRYHNTIAACARSPVLRERYASLQREAMGRVAKAARAGQRAGRVRRDVPAAALGEILVILTMGIGLMLDLEIPFDLASGAKTLRALVRPKP